MGFSIMRCEKWYDTCIIRIKISYMAKGNNSRRKEAKKPKKSKK